MDHPSDGELLLRFRRGETEAFRALVLRHESALLRHARALAAADRTLAEDAVQDALIRLIERPPTLPDSVLGECASEHAYLAAWLHKVTRNACMDRLRSESRRRRRENERAAPELDVLRHDAVEHDDTKAAVEREMARLSPEQREVLALRLFADRSYAEIAEITGKKVGTVGWLISTGLRALSRELEPLLGLEDERAERITSIGGRAS
ncbi:MAG: sigma-70 family RNA polymerase sigma factor [Planctomycetota bacterium]|nr:MAG: sigma-70 family RNA polymerase sigma factor [Planctomycetota bacterium]